ncbi:MAG: AI-2E family transporter [Clostridia bacterium]|nr:AI-2E family transporter [Clostridia bacterium]
MPDIDEKGSFGSKIKKLWLNFLYLIPVLLITIIFLIFRDRLTHIINPLIIAAVSFFVLNPFVEWFEKKGRVKRSGAVAVVFLIALTVIVGIITFIIPVLKENVSEIVENIPLIKENIKTFSVKIYDFFESLNSKFVDRFFESILNEDISDSQGGLSVVETAEEKISETVASWAEPGNIVNIAKTILDIVTSVVITFYLLRDKEKAGNFILSVFPYSWREFLIEIYTETEKVCYSFISGQFIIAFIIGFLETLGLWIIGAPYPLLLGIIGGLSNLIPYFGPFIGAVPAVAAMLIVSPFKALFVVLLFIIVQQIDNNFISPKIIEGKLGIHPVATIFAVFIGGEFFGLFGMLFAVPLYAIIHFSLKRLTNNLTPQMKK